MIYVCNLLTLFDARKILVHCDYSSSNNSHAVAKLLRERKLSGSTPANRTDNHTIALIVEGGGIRASIGAGMIAGLVEVGYGNCIDAVYGASAGSSFLLTSYLVRHT